MEAVTSVLLERARHDTGLPRMVSASLVGHVALVALLMAASAIGGRVRGEEERDIMTISLGGAPGPNAGGMTMMGSPARPRAEVRLACCSFVFMASYRCEWFQRRRGPPGRGAAPAPASVPRRPG